IGGGCTGCSDARFKRNMRPIVNALEAINRLQPVRFDWRRDEFPKREFSDRHQIGLIAQEVEQIVPEVVFKESDGYYSIDYSKLTPLLIEAIREQQKSIESQARQIASLKQKDDELVTQRETIDRLEQRLAALEKTVAFEKPATNIR